MSENQKRIINDTIRDIGKHLVNEMRKKRSEENLKVKGGESN
jgi:hypothetical protein